MALSSGEVIGWCDALPKPWPIHAHAIYRAIEGDGVARAVAMVKFIDPVSGQGQRELSIAPPLSLEFADASQVVPNSASRG